MKLMICTPAFDGKVDAAFSISLAETYALCLKHNIEVFIRINNSGSLLCAERNRLVKTFIESDCTHVLFIDSDLGWPAQAVIEMINKDENFIAGLYPARGNKSFIFRPVLNDDKSFILNKEKSIIKMEYIPAGFMLLKRHVLEKMIEDNPERKFIPKDKNSDSGYALFNTELYEGEFWGEDYVFCRLARKSGFEIWIDPLIQFNHSGNIGMFAEILTTKKID